MLIKGIPKRWKTHTKNDPKRMWKIRILKKKKHASENRKEGPGRIAESVPQGPGDTIRSKIEDQLTKEKLKDRESAAHPNTPWAPSGPERIELPEGKVPHVALARCNSFDEGVCDCFAGAVRTRVAKMSIFTE